ncbi:hypothetical protein, partial [Chitinivorax sp. B]|uniref:hypothetical protein n=1 Tax=Chitinivorax sp. B TaxID=2502235 RepID=UPI001BB203FA
CSLNDMVVTIGGKVRSVEDLLSADELMHLAIEASGRERYDLAIGYLKQAYAKASAEPDETLPRAEIPFLLGAQYAQIKMFEDAKRWMREAVSLNPQFDIAVFQLGLLELLGGELAAGEQTWSGLDFLPAGHALLHFRAGLLALAREQYPLALTELRQGLAVGLANAPLMAEMQRILSNVEAQQAQVGTTDSPSVAADSPAEAHVLLAAYRE